MKKIFIFLIAIFIYGFCFGNEVDYEYSKGTEALNLTILIPQKMYMIETISCSSTPYDFATLYVYDEQEAFELVSTLVQNYEKNKYKTFIRQLLELCDKKEIILNSEPKMMLEEGVMYKIYLMYKKKP